MVIDTGEPWGVGLNETFLPRYLKRQGYTTHAIGKVIYVKRISFEAIIALRWIVPFLYLFTMILYVFKLSL